MKNDENRIASGKAGMAEAVVRTQHDLVHHLPLSEVMRRYRNAKRRALYWSGNPSFSVRSRETRSSRLSEKYELAMCDCKNWEHDIEAITGKKPEHYDPKAKFRQAFSRLWVNPKVQTEPRFGGGSLEPVVGTLNLKNDNQGE